MTTELFRQLVDEEKKTQNMKWGHQYHDHYTWYTIMMEEVGELAKCFNDNKSVADMVGELVQIVAVVEQWVNLLDEPGEL